MIQKVFLSEKLPCYGKTTAIMTGRIHLQLHQKYVKNQPKFEVFRKFYMAGPLLKPTFVRKALWTG